MRFFSAICGILIVMGSLAAAQEPATQDPPMVRRPQRQAPMDRQYPATPVSQIAPAVVQQQPPPQPQQPPQSAAPAPTASPVPVPQAPEHLPPPTPAVVTYQNGLLTVQAMNSTLGGLLTAIRNKTGIQFEGLEGGAPERVAIAMGPAPSGEVLAAILSGSGFDYVVMGRPDSPGTVQRVLLMPRGGATPTVAGAQPAHPAAGEGDEEDVAEEQASGDPEPQDTPARPPLTQAQQQQQQQPDQPKTPEQLMQQLQQMQQQRQQQLQQQQQQQQQSPQNQAPVKPPPAPQ